MITIQIAYEVPASTVAKIQEHLSETALNDVNWGGATFVIERNDFTCIPDEESIDAVSLLQEINRIISGD